MTQSISISHRSSSPAGPGLCLICAGVSPPVPVDFCCAPTLRRSPLLSMATSSLISESRGQCVCCGAKSSSSQECGNQLPPSWKPVAIGEGDEWDGVRTARDATQAPLAKVAGAEHSIPKCRQPQSIESMFPLQGAQKCRSRLCAGGCRRKRRSSVDRTKGCSGSGSSQHGHTPRSPCVPPIPPAAVASSMSRIPVDMCEVGNFLLTATSASARSSGMYPGNCCVNIMGISLSSPVTYSVSETTSTESRLSRTPICSTDSRRGGHVSHPQYHSVSSSTNMISNSTAQCEDASHGLRAPLPETMSSGVFEQQPSGPPAWLATVETPKSICHDIMDVYRPSLRSADTTTILPESAAPERTCWVDSLVQLDSICKEILGCARPPQYGVKGTVGVANNGRPSICTYVALDLEGINLGRCGSVSILTLATERCIFLIDIMGLGTMAFSDFSPLRMILESPRICKLMFDCRADCDALYFLYGVRLRNVCDLQIVSCYALFSHPLYLPSMKDTFRLLGLLTPGETRIKEEGRACFDPKVGGSLLLWEQRPLAPLLLHYCSVDVKYFFLACAKMSNFMEQGMTLGEERLQMVCDGLYMASSISNAKREFAM